MIMIFDKDFFFKDDFDKDYISLWGIFIIKK